MTLINAFEPTMAAALEAIANEVAAQRRIPRATYRLQLNRSFTFRDAAALVPYLADLGVSDCYASPILKARPGSAHGYDLTDHSQLNPELGSAGDFDALSAALQQRGMGLVLDTVPNHMGIHDASNIWWMDVLENGPSSIYASYFDIQWQPVKEELHNKVLLPVLEDQYGTVLEAGKLRLHYEDGAFFMLHYSTRLPLAPRSYRLVLARAAETLTAALGAEQAPVQESQSIITALNYLPPPTERDPERVAERQREKEVIKRRIAALYASGPEAQAALDGAVQLFNGEPGNPRSFDLLDELLDAQSYRLAFWRVAAEEINYRRFFDINDLTALRVELPEVFAASHELILRYLAEGKVTGLRIDHPDGLWNPTEYLRRLQEQYFLHWVRSRLPAGRAADGQDTEMAAWCLDLLTKSGGPAAAAPLYVVVEKILGDGEQLPDDWTVSGTSGYEFVNAVNGLFVDSANRKHMDAVYRHFIRRDVNLPALINSSKKMIMLISLASEINMLAHQLNRISDKNRRYRDFTLNSLTFAIREVVACLKVYRTYTLPGQPVSERDRAYIEQAVAGAKRNNPRTAESIFDFIGDTLLLRNIEDFREEDRDQMVDFVMKFQQVTGPVMAKALEDTVFYVYNRLVSLNEVGGEPERFGLSVAEFHQRNAARRERWPHGLLASSTHDTKRSEDVRARINVLSELPGEWRAALARWGRMNRNKKRLVDGQPAPDFNDEYLLYQTLLGVWPLETPGPEQFAEFRERIAAYMLKATREAKVHTSWINPNDAYDAAVRRFVLDLLGTGENAFVQDLRAFQRRIAHFGALNSLAQHLLKLTAPGVPDLYQGTEVWDLSLVDPDNRRTVDFEARQAMLSGLREELGREGVDLTELAGALLESWRDGRIKLFLTHQVLHFRRDHPELFAEGDYLPLEASGARREQVCAFARRLGEQGLIVAAPRLAVRLTNGAERPPVGAEVWQDTWLALPHETEGVRYRNLLTGEVLNVEVRDGAPGLPLASICATLPLAALARLTDA